MSIINKILARFIGTKAQTDLRETQPIVDKIKLAYQEIEKLSNDELRERTQQLKIKISDYIRAEEDEIDRLLKREARVGQVKGELRPKGEVGESDEANNDNSPADHPSDRWRCERRSRRPEPCRRR